MNILLINVSKNWKGRVYKEYPLGLGMLGTIASNAGHNLKILDLAVDDSDPIKIILNFKPDITGLSFLSTSSYTAKNLITKLKKIKCGHLISGGIHTSIFPLNVLKWGFDFVGVGEGELFFPTLINALKDVTLTTFYNKSDFINIPNIGFRDVNGEYFFTNKTSDSVDLDSLPIVDRNLFNKDKYSNHSIVSSRGCIYNCKFCCSWGSGGKKGRFASPEKIIAEFRYLINEIGAKTVYWADDMFFMNQEQRLNFCTILEKENLDLDWDWVIQLRASEINKELIIALKKAGCSKIAIGAESGSNKVLKNIGKGISAEEVEEGINCAIKFGMKIKTWWIIGLPGSDFSEEIKTLELIKRTKPHEVAIHTFVPLPGTVFWDEASFYNINLPVIENVEDLYYYSSYENVKLNSITYNEFKKLLNLFIETMDNMGYSPADNITNNTEYVYTTPLQKKTFSI